MSSNSNNYPASVAGTMMSDPRSGGVKRSSGVNVHPIVGEAWAEVRNDANSEVDWILIGYDGNSKTDLTLIEKGKGGIEAVSSKLPTAGGAVFGGSRLFSNNKNGRFVHFVYVHEDCPAMKKGRTLMYKNGVFNVLLGCDGEIEMKPGLTEKDMGPVR